MQRRDAARNRERLLAVAAAAFARDGVAVTFGSIARDAGVGIGTLYRHFPDRAALVEAVYRAELEQVCAQAAVRLAKHRPHVALRRWFDDYADYFAAKRGMGGTLQAAVASGAVVAGETRAAVTAAVAQLLAAGVRAGTVRRTVRADDVVAAMVGAFLSVGRSGEPLTAEQREQVNRILDLIVAGVRAR